MQSGQHEQHVEERVTVLTDGERIEGLTFHMGGARLSDFLNSSVQQESKFLKVKDAAIYSRSSGNELIQVPFVMVSRDKIVMVMTHSSYLVED